MVSLTRFGVSADEILHSLPLEESHEHVLSHNKLWEALSSEITNIHDREKLHEMLQRHNAHAAPNWSKLNAELAAETGISKATLEFIRKSFDIHGQQFYFQIACLPES